MTGISTRNLGCFIFLIFPASFGLLRGFSKVEKSAVLAWTMASSFVVGGLGDERVHMGKKCEIFDSDLSWGFPAM